MQRAPLGTSGHDQGVVTIALQVQPGPEANELFSEPRHSIEVNSPAAAIPEGHPLDQSRVGSIHEPSMQPTTWLHSHSGNGAKPPAGVEGRAPDVERGTELQEADEAEPGITRTSTGEDFEACAGPCGRDGCATALLLTLG